MRKKLVVVLISSFLLFLLGSLTMAQEREQLRKQRREKDLRETIKIYMYYKMKSALELTEEQDQKIIPIVEEMEVEKHRFMEQKRLLLKDLEEMLADTRTSDDAILKRLDQLHEMDEKFRKNEEEILSQIGTILSPRQRARFLLFMVDFTRELQNKIENIRRMQENEDMRRRRMSEQHDPGRDDE
ncbi:MAG: hypothetical protein AB1756_07545 [Acidobacteriota bacterium]